jgi:hypothetical protein
VVHADNQPTASCIASRSIRGGRTGSTPRSRTTATSRAEHGNADTFSVAGGESGYIAVDPRNANIIYAGNYGGTIQRTDRYSGVSESVPRLRRRGTGSAPPT